MQEPSLRTSRLVIAGGLAAAIALAVAGFIAGKATSHDSEPRDAAAPAEVASRPPPERPRILQRRDIIAAVHLSADAHAAGRPLPGEVAELAGRRFDLAIPFGCDGPAPADSKAPLRWQYDKEQQTLRVHVTQTYWRPADWGIHNPASERSGAEGFWISRPWTSSETCPPPSGAALVTDAQPVTLPGQTLAIAQFVSNDAGDAGATPRSFDLTKRLAPDRFDATKGLRLRLLGRIRALAGHAPISCIQPAGGEQRPICVVSVSFEEVSVEVASSGERLGTWPLGQFGGPLVGD